MAADWFHKKWGVPKEAYLECMTAYLEKKTEYGWYLCLDGSEIVGGLGVIENDFHDRKDLAPNVCAVYTEESHRKRGIFDHGQLERVYRSAGRNAAGNGPELQIRRRRYEGMPAGPYGDPYHER